jgi:hypothetical protein
MWQNEIEKGPIFSKYEYDYSGFHFRGSVWFDHFIISDGEVKIPVMEAPFCQALNYLRHDCGEWTWILKMRPCFALTLCSWGFWKVLRYYLITWMPVSYSIRALERRMRNKHDWLSSHCRQSLFLDCPCALHANDRRFVRLRWSLTLLGEIELMSS